MDTSAPICARFALSIRQRTVIIIPTNDAGCAMRFVVLAVVLSATIPSFCQKDAAQHPLDPDQIFQMPKQFQAPPDLSNAANFKARLPISPLPRIVVPTHPPKVDIRDLDVEMIHRPVQGSFAEQSPRSPLASNVYPDLKLLPVESAR